MGDVVTLEELSATPTGQQILAERDAKQQTDAEAQEATRKQRADELHARAAELAETVTKKRTEVLALAAGFADAFDELDDAYSGLSDARRHLHSLGETLAMPVTLVKERDVKRLIQRVQAMARRFGRPL